MADRTGLSAYQKYLGSTAYLSLERKTEGHITLCFLALVMQIKFQKLLEETQSKYRYTETIRDLRKVYIAKLKVKNQEHLVRTEVHGAAAAAFKAVGLRVPERVQTEA